MVRKKVLATILIVEDHPDMRDALCDLLEERGYQVTTAMDGRQALEKVRERRFFNIVLLDMKIPGMDGMELLQSIKGMNKEIIVIVMTAYGTMEDVIEAMRRGAYDYITKPPDVEEMISIIERSILRQKLGLEDKRLLDTLQRSKVELSKRLGDLLTLKEEAGRRRSNLESSLTSIIDTVSEVMGSKRVSLMLLDEELNELRIKVARGLSKAVIEKARVKVGERISGAVAKKGEPLLSVNMDGNPNFEASSRNYKSNSFLCVPVKLEGKVVGVLNVTDRAGNHSFSDEDLQLTTILARQAAVAIESSSIYEKMERAYRELKRSQEELIRSEKLVTIGRLATGIAHEMNNPLSIISGSAQLALNSIDESEPTLKRFKEVGKDLKAILRETERCARIGKALLTFAQEAGVEPEPTDLRGVLEEHRREE